MWTIYIMGLLFLYAPSHKQWPTSSSSNTLNDQSGDNTSRTGEEIEFAMSSKRGATSPTEESELSSLTKFSFFFSFSTHFRLYYFFVFSFPHLLRAYL